MAEPLNAATEYAEHLEGMAETIDKYGHTKNKLGDEEVGYCLLGAGRKTKQWEHPSILLPLSFMEDDPSRVDLEAAYEEANRIDWLTTQALGLVDRNAVERLNDGIRKLGDGTVGLDKEQAIDLCISKAKEWRNK